VLIAKNVVEEARFLSSKELKGFKLGVLHGKMKRDEKEAVMEQFAEGDLDVLVATSVIEVGINVPNATAIIIEGAERFGLSQLHQLRGRVARSEKHARCFLVTDTESESSIERLKVLVNAKSGFELAERDLQMRGPGELVGVRQSGISDIAMEALKNLKMVEAARNAARDIIELDPELKENNLLGERVSELEKLLHKE
jgi:ATP-dependent DNA helicase RecG